MKAIISKFALALLGAAMVSNANAVEKGFYFALGAGQADYSNELPGQVRAAYDGFQGTPTAVLTTANMADDNDSYSKLLLGYQINEWLAAEASYNDLGSAKLAFELIQQSAARTQVMGLYDFRSSNLALNAGITFAENFRLSGRVGAAFTRLDYSETTNVVVNGAPYTFKGPTDSQTRALLGVGISWLPTSNWELRLDWDRYLNVGTRFALNNDTNGKFDAIDQFGLLLAYRLNP